MSITVYGASDDLIEVEGDLSEEWSPLSDGASDDGGLLAFSDGTVLRVAYTDDGVWRVTPLSRGSATMTKTEAVDADDDNYSDRVTLDGDIRWVVFGSEYKPVFGSEYKPVKR